MRTLFILITLWTLTNCSGVREVTIEKRSINFSLYIYRHTGKTFLVGHGGFFIREQSKYIIELPDNKGLIPFDKLKVEKDRKPQTVNGGTIEFIDKGRLTISLTKEVEGKTVDMEINGTFKIE